MTMTISLDQLGGWMADLPEEAALVYDSVRRWAQTKWLPDVNDHFDAGTFPLEVARELGALGVLGANLEGYGCAGMSHVAYGMAMRALGYVDSGLRSFASVQGALTMYAIHRFGDEAQRQRWLPRLASAELVGCFGLSEPGSGSDPGSMTTVATRDGSDWVLNGEKLWITNAPVADIMVVWAKTGEDVGSIRGFVLERGMDGLSTPPIPRKMSMRASFTGSLVMSDVRVPGDHILPESGGLGSPLGCINNARLSVAFGVLGASRFCLETALKYTQERVQFGVALAQKQLVQAQLSEMATRQTCAELLVLNVATLKDRRQASPYKVSMAKRESCATALKIARQARALLGGNGITLDYHVIRHALNLESTFTYEGTDEIHALILGRGLTGFNAF